MTRRRWALAVGIVAVLLALPMVFQHSAATEPPVQREPTTARAAKPGSTAIGPRLASISGTIVDVMARPIAGARVCVVDDCVTTGATGAFMIGALAAGEYRVRAGAPHHLPKQSAELVLAIAEPRRDIVLVLADGGVTVTGVVSDRGGGPIVHARVSGFDQSRMEGTAVVETNDHGAFELWTWPGTLFVGAVADGYRETGTSVGAPANDVALVLEPESVLAGIVVDATTKQPIANATVVTGVVGELHTVTNAAGRFELLGLDPGRYSLVATSPSGFGRTPGSIAVGYRGRVDEITIELYPAVSLIATVMHAGQRCEHPDVGIDNENTRGERGLVRVDGVLPGPHKVVVGCERARHEETIEVATTDIARTFALDSNDELPPVPQEPAPTGTGTIAGTVVDREGHPQRGVHVLIACDCPDYPVAQTDAAGAFHFADVPAARRVALMVDLGYASVHRNVEVAANATASLQVVVDGGTAKITGVVVDEHGAPVADVLVAAEDDKSGGLNPPHAETASDGTFVLEVGAAGTYTVSTSRASSPRLAVEHVAPGAHVKLQFEAGATIAGIARDSDGTPLQNFEVDAGGDRARRFEHYFHTAGRFQIEGLPAGPYELVVTTNGRSARTRLTVAAGERATTELVLDGSVSVTGRVLDLVTKEPLAGLHVTMQAGASHSVSTAGDGRFTIRAVSPGEILVSIGNTGYIYVRAGRTAKKGETIALGDVYTMRARPTNHDPANLGIEVDDDHAITRISDRLAGPVVGDVITAIDGIDVTSATAQLIEGLLFAERGTVIRVTVARGPTTYALTILSAR